MGRYPGKWFILWEIPSFLINGEKEFKLNLILDWLHIYLKKTVIFHTEYNKSFFCIIYCK